jgi:hypothetical protein
MVGGKGMKRKVFIILAVVCLVVIAIPTTIAIVNNNATANVKKQINQIDNYIGYFDEDTEPPNADKITEQEKSNNSDDVSFFAEEVTTQKSNKSKSSKKSKSTTSSNNSNQNNKSKNKQNSNELNSSNSNTKSDTNSSTNNNNNNGEWLPGYYD